MIIVDEIKICHISKKSKIWPLQNLFLALPCLESQISTKLIPLASGPDSTGPKPKIRLLTKFLAPKYKTRNTPINLSRLMRVLENAIYAIQVLMRPGLTPVSTAYPYQGIRYYDRHHIQFDGPVGRLPWGLRLACVDTCPTAYSPQPTAHSLQTILYQHCTCCLALREPPRLPPEQHAPYQPQNDKKLSDK